MQGVKVVTTEEMGRIETGGDHEKYMANAGRKVAEVVMQYVESHNLLKEVTLLVGKGNNGGDAYAAGLWLIEEGYRVSAYVLYDEVSDLNQKFREKFQKKGGKFTEKLEGVLVDGLLGTGFKGSVEAKMGRLIHLANESGLSIIAIDIPSGLNATTGRASSTAIFAKETVCLGLFKIGLFIQDGWNHIGKLHLADFGLPEKNIAEAEAVAYVPKKLDLPKMSRSRHKYQAGYVVGYAGSKELSGAAKMAGFAALKAGAGIVRIFLNQDIGLAPPELICNLWNAKTWKEALKKANAVFIGPGLGKAKDWLKKHLKEIKQPCVIDADALLPGIDYPKGSILTPHRGEVLRLLGLEHPPRDEELFAKLIRYCSRHQLYVVLKGGPTIVFGPKHKPIIIPRGDPGMATAGTGDVLTGMISALLAQGCGSYEAAILGVALHAIAGEKAAKALTSYCVTATSLIEFMPSAFQDVLKGHNLF